MKKPKKTKAFLFMAVLPTVSQNILVRTGNLYLSRRATHKIGISNQLIFTGAIPNNELPSYYATADIFIGPSIRAKSGITEGFGLTFVEAGMCGAWLIGSNVGGVSDIIQEGVNGNLVEEKNTPQIASAIINALEKGKSATLGRESTFKSFDWDVIAAKYAQCLNQATQEGQENETTYSN